MIVGESDQSVALGWLGGEGLEFAAAFAVVDEGGGEAAGAGVADRAGGAWRVKRGA